MQSKSQFNFTLRTLWSAHISPQISTDIRDDQSDQNITMPNKIRVCSSKCSTGRADKHVYIQQKGTKSGMVLAVIIYHSYPLVRDDDGPEFQRIFADLRSYRNIFNIKSSIEISFSISSEHNENCTKSYKIRTLSYIYTQR